MNCVCGKEITVGSLVKREKGKVYCEKCLGIRNPYDNPEEYKYFWGGKMVSLDELPSFAYQLFPALRGRNAKN